MHNANPNSPATAKAGPLIATGTMLGLGLGGFLDGIILHQLLQWHQMISAVLPPDTLLNKSINMFWDGIFESVTWTLTAIGLYMFWQLFKRNDVLRSGTAFCGALLFGWGFFNLIDSIGNHYIFNFHNVRENTANPQLWNHGFLALAIIQIIIGWLIIQNGRKKARV